MDYHIFDTKGSRDAADWLPVIDDYDNAHSTLKGAITALVGANVCPCIAKIQGTLLGFVIPVPQEVYSEIDGEGNHAYVPLNHVDEAWYIKGLI